MKKLFIFILLCFLIPTIGCAQEAKIYIGEDGYWYINDVNTNVYAKGDTGLQGETGKDGHTPVITIKNGYWYVDDVNTEILAEGKDGKEGKEGKQGNSIVDIVKTESNGLEDIYTILFSDGNKTTFSVKNGESGKDTYELAKEQGYTGSLEEWLKDLTDLDVYEGDSTSKLTSRIERRDNQIVLVVNYDEEVTYYKGNIKENAYEDLSYEDIFEKNNILPNNMNSMNSNTDMYKDYAGSTTIQYIRYNTKDAALYVTGTTSQQAISQLTYSGEYYLASKVRCVRYVQGWAGIVVGSDKTLWNGIALTSTSDSFVTCSGIRTLTDDNIFFGSAGSANLDAYIDDTVGINLNIFKVKPSEEKLNELYEGYLDRKNKLLSVTSWTETVQREKTYLLGEEYGKVEEPTVTDVQAKKYFMEYMNKKAREIGMNSTTFVDAAGFYNRTTALDLIRMGMYACSYDEIVDTWHKNSYSITIEGPSARTITVNTTVTSSNLENYYFLYGGKTGTVDGQQNLLCVCLGPDDRLFVVVILGAIDNRFTCARQAMDEAVKKYNDPTYNGPTSAVNAGAAAVALLPLGNTKGYVSKTIDLLYAKDVYSSRTPASITKVMTSICMLDFVYDINTKFTIKTLDITSGSGPSLNNGDIMTYKEGLHAMLLPSSNTTAEAVATSVGHIMYSYDNK